MKSWHFHPPSVTHNATTWHVDCWLYIRPKWLSGTGRKKERRKHVLTCGKLGNGCSIGVVGRTCLCSRRLMGWQADDCCKLNKMTHNCKQLRVSKFTENQTFYNCLLLYRISWENSLTLIRLIAVCLFS